MTRTGTYYWAIMSNRQDFEGKVVVDVGAGTGILSLFAAQVPHARSVLPARVAAHPLHILEGSQHQSVPLSGIDAQRLWPHQPQRV
jgi:type I protein arginine methyltransferase